MNLQKQLVGHWTCDSGDTSGSTLRDRSGYGNHGSMSGGITTGASSPVGEGFSFDATDDTVSMGDISDVDGIPEMTFTCWVNWGTTTDNARLYQKDPENAHTLVWSPNSSTVSWRVEDSSATRTTIDASFTTGKWTHFAFVVDFNSGGSYVYKDGSQVSSASVTQGEVLASSSGPVRLGSDRGSDNFFGGDVSDARLYTRALSADEISALANMRTARRNEHPLAKGQVGKWTMNDSDTQGGVLHDRSGHGNHAGLNGGVTTSVSGPVGEAYSFDGTDDILKVDAASLPDPLSDVTITFWAKPGTGGSTPTTVLRAVSDASSNRLNIHFPWKNGSIYWDFGDTSNGGRLTASYDSAWQDVWAHYTFISESGVGQRIYRNGTEIASDGTTDTFSVGSKDIWIGADNSGNPWAGDLAMGRIFARALSVEEIKRLANQSAMQEVQL